MRGTMSRTFIVDDPKDVRVMRGITVEELIRELKKMPQKSLVGIRDFDNGIDEISGFVQDVERFDSKASFDPEYCKGVKVVINAG